MSKKTKIIPIFVPHLGCPNDCIFCNQKKITNVSTSMTPEKAKDIIEEHLETLDSNKYSIEISFFGGTFTGIDKVDQKLLLNVALDYKESGRVEKIRLSTRPDRVDSSIIDLLKAYKVDIVELGVQSLDDEVLRASNRGHNAHDVIGAVERLKTAGFKVGIQIMPGLYKTNYLSDLKTLNQVIDLSPDFVRLYPTLVIKGTRLKELYENDDYTPLSVEKAVEFCKIAYVLFESRDINIIRMGLQPTDGISWGNDVVSGPFHPAFRSLVLSSLYGDYIESVLDGNEYKNAEFNVPQSLISFVVGQNKSNVARYKKYICGSMRFEPKRSNEDFIELVLKDMYGEVQRKILDLSKYCKKAAEKYRTLEGGVVEFKKIRTKRI